MDKRRFIDQLPEVHQTETLKKFFGSTVDQVFQPGQAENLSGYIGTKPVYYNPDRDFYKPEPNIERTVYQLDPAMVSQNAAGTVTNLLSYDDLIGYLQAEGANTADHNRLFGDDFYGWVPPVDLDKLENFRQYFWFGDAPHLMPVVVLSVASTPYTADGKTYQFDLPAALPGIDAARETPCIFVDGLPADFVRVGDTLELVQMPVEGQDVRTFRYGDLTAVLTGQTTFDPTPFNATVGLAALTSNMRVRFEDGVSYFQGFGRMPYEQELLKVPNLCQTTFPVAWDSYTRPSEFFVEGCGTSIAVVPYPSNMTFKATDPYYYVIDRRSRERSPWVVNNFWVHEDAFRWAGVSFSSRRARRPIVEMVANLELLNYGTTRIADCTHTLTGDPLFCPVVLDRPDAVRGISDWDVYPFDTEGYESAGARPLALATANGKLPGQLFVDGGRAITYGDRILVLQNDIPDLDGVILDVRMGKVPVSSGLTLEGVSAVTPLILTETGGYFNLETSNPDLDVIDVMVLMPDSTAKPGDVTALPRGRFVKWDAPSGNDPWFLAHTGVDDLPWEYMSERTEYHYTDGGWTDAQAPHADQREPLFALYTADKVRHDLLPSSTFVGNRLFGYAPATVETGVLDPVLNRYVILDGSLPTFTFDQYTVRATSAGQDIPGFQWFRIRNADGTSRYGNSWNPTGERSYQRLTEGLFETPPNLLSNPDNAEPTQIVRSQWLDNLSAVFLRQTGFSGSPFNRNNWRDTARTLGTGFTGPTWVAGTVYAVGAPVTYLQRVYTCAVAHTAGTTFDSSLWTARPTHTITQSRSPLLRTMLLASDTRFDYMDAARYVDQEYARFRNKFRSQTTQVRITGGRRDSDDLDLWVDTVLANLQATKTPEFPFALSSMGGAQYYIPPTAAQMGLFSVYQPGYETDDTYTPAATFLRGHDGSRTPVTGAFEDDVLLALELRIWRAILAKFKTEAKPPFDITRYLEGKWRGNGGGDTVVLTPNPCNIDPTPTETGSPFYTDDEFARLLTPDFLSYTQLNGIDYQAHDDYVGLDPFTWNYRGYRDVDGMAMPGNWRAIYRLYYDTDRPHAAPWEMLGFVQKPSWWERQYGVAPYTLGNTVLWQDLRDGRIRQGLRAGIDPLYVRQDLLRFLPVDEDGKLLNPMQIGIFAAAPTAADAARTWLVGDGGPGEQVWRNSASFPYALARVCYLMRPAEWIETTWESATVLIADDGQILNTRVARRLRASDVLVHGETQNSVTATRYAFLGVQQWISDYMVSRNQNPSILGNAMRAMRVQLAHKMAGFTQQENMRVFADNFGILPKQDVSVVLHTAPPVREAVYSGVIIEWVGDGYKIIGYDTDKEGFCVNPGDPNSIQIKIALGDDPIVYEWHLGVYYPLNILVTYQGTNYRCVLAHTASSTFDSEFWVPEPTASKSYPKVTVAANGLGTPTYIPYGTVLHTIQEVANFLWDYGRLLSDQGFVFDYIDPQTGAVVDWDLMIRDFLAWAQMDWQPGSFIALSPGASQLKFKTATGFVLNLEQTANGIYGLLDRTGRPIAKANTFVSRLDDETKVITLTNDLFYARMRVALTEHVILFNNTTIFGDIVYAPLLSLRQPRLRLYALRTTDWTGRLDAPGFMVEDDTVEFNFWSATENLRTMFEVEGSEDQSLRDFSRHLVGYQKRPYLDDLLISETEQFEFYQGMIRAKGAPTVFERLTRSNVIDQQSDLQFLEEWGFRVGQFGATETFDRVGFVVTRADMRANPQLIDMGTKPLPYDGVLQIPANSTRWIETPRDITAVFPDRSSPPEVNNTSPTIQTYGRDLTTAGPVRLDEITYSILFPSYGGDLYVALTNVNKTINGGDRLWVYDMQEKDTRYEVYRADYLGDATAGYARLIQVQTSVNGDATLSPGVQRLIFNVPHQMTPDDLGRLVVVPYSIAPTSDVEGLHVIVAIDSPYSVIVPYANEVQAYTRQPYCMVMRSVHFATLAERDAHEAAYGFAVGEICYVDAAPGFSGWVVYQRVAPTPSSPSLWTVYRQQPAQRVDSYRLRNTLIYNLNTEISKATLAPQALHTNHITIVDPIVGNIAGQAEREIRYRTDIDPAMYGADDMWTGDRVGHLWWDTGMAVFLETTTDILDPTNIDRYNREMNYRVENWGKVAPGCSINVWEWTRSLVDPITLMQSDDYPYTNATVYNTTTEFDPTLGRVVTAYYFWVLNPTVTPNVAERSMSAQQVASLISDPKAADLPWVAPVSETAMLLCNVEELLNDTSTVVQFEITNTPKQEGVAHTQYALARKGDDDAMPPAELVTMLRNSLAGFDDFVRLVPEGGLMQFDVVGATTRARRTMFDDGRAGVLAARESFVTRLNQIVAETPLLINQPSALAALTQETPVYDRLMWTQPEGVDWIEAPPRGSYDFAVNGLDERAALLTQDVFLAALGFDTFSTVGYDTRGWDYDFSISNADRPNFRLPRILMTNYAGDRPSWSIWQAQPVLKSGSAIGTLLPPLNVGNLPPVAVDDHIRVEANVRVSIDALRLLANDYDPNRDPLTVTSVGPAAESDGVVLRLDRMHWVFIPADTVSYPVVFPYAISDGRGGVATARVILDTTCQGDVIPSGARAIADSFNVAQGQTLTLTADQLLLNDRGIGITVISVTQPAYGRAVYTGAQIIYTPPADPTRISDTFTYTIQGSDGVVSSALVTVNITNAPPVANDDKYLVTGGSTTVFTTGDLLRNDTGTGLSIFTISPPVFGSAALQSDGIVYTAPATDETITDSMTYTIIDAYRRKSTGSIVITVDPGSDLPPIIIPPILQ